MAREYLIQMRVMNNSVQKTINELSKTNMAFQEGIAAIIEETAMAIQKDTIMPSTFPVITGSLRSGYQVDVRKTKRDLAASVFNDIDYAPAVEFGINQRAQPYFVPAINMNAERYFKAVEKLIEKATK